MALPKLGYPTYECELPSSGKTIKYRPFLVKEEKVLLMALEANDEKQVIGGVKDLLKNCVISRIKVDQLPSFDLEYLFLKIRAASIGEMITLSVTCLDDNETEVEALININDVEVKKQEGHSPKIMFDDTTGIMMKYPSMKQFIDREFLQKDLGTEDVYDFIANSIDQIFDDEEVYDSSTTTPKEFRQFVDTLTTKQFEKIQDFYATCPKLSHTFSVTNPKTGKESTYTIEGLQSFFA
ncbi:MAG: baseplate protein [Ectothiorhodospiraceae bacterium]|nr:baseplate protein [Ectothiorhodospiraceae bacterium]|tara:strand:+ start:158 stop:871 length:714 start_codon:yes stop_codon:yes gene_type:complete